MDELNSSLEALSLTEFLRWSLDTFGEKIAHVTSFGPSGVVILDHLLRLKPNARVITLDTQFLFEETYDLWQSIERRYAIRHRGDAPQALARGAGAAVRRQPVGAGAGRLLRHAQGAAAGRGACRA